MKDKVVYLFGAGASFNAIPVVSGMGVRLKTFLNYFKFFNLSGIQTEAEYTVDLKWYNLVDEVNESFSIDTLARRAWLSGDNEKISQIKELIGAYILWEQIVKPDQSSSPDYIQSTTMLNFNYREATNRFNYYWDGSLNAPVGLEERDMKLRNYDYRYESLMSVIADKPNIVDDRFSFVSWNYDNQVEMAIARIFNLGTDSNELTSDNEALTNRITNQILGNRFVKLNGSASLSNFDFEPVSRFNKSSKNSELKKIKEMLIGNAKFCNRILFAWERSEEFNRTRAYSLLAEAKYIVIVGYSFPEYNREIDKQLINNAAIGLNKKFIIQDTAENIDRIESRLKSIRHGIDVLKITDLNQFYIPL